MDTGDTGCVTEPVWVEGGGPFGPREPQPEPCVDTGAPEPTDYETATIVEGDGGLGCTSAPVGPSMLAVLLLLARRLPLLVLLMSALPARAGVDAQQLQILEGGDWLALREPTVGLPNSASFAAGVVHARRPVVLAQRLGSSGASSARRGPGPPTASSRASVTHAVSERRRSMSSRAGSMASSASGEA